MKNRVVNFNFELKSLDGKSIGNAGEVLAAHIGMSNEGNALKLYGWAVACQNGEDINLDSSDFRTLREWVEANKTLSILAKGQILIHLDNVKYDKD